MCADRGRTPSSFLTVFRGVALLRRRRVAHLAEGGEGGMERCGQWSLPRRRSRRRRPDAHARHRQLSVLSVGHGGGGRSRHPARDERGCSPAGSCRRPRLRTQTDFRARPSFLPSFSASDPNAAKLLGIVSVTLTHTRPTDGGSPRVVSGQVALLIFHWGVRASERASDPVSGSE